MVDGIGASNTAEVKSSVRDRRGHSGKMRLPHGGDGVMKDRGEGLTASSLPPFTPSMEHWRDSFVWIDRRRPRPQSSGDISHHRQCYVTVPPAVVVRRTARRWRVEVACCSPGLQPPRRSDC